MSATPLPRDPGPDGDPSGVPAGPGDHPWLGSPDWPLVPQSPDWPEWMDDDAQVGADPARRAWRTSSADALLSHMKAFPESGAAPPGWRSPVRA